MFTPPASKKWWLSCPNVNMQAGRISNKNVGFWSDYIYLVMERDVPATSVGTLIATGSWISIGVLAGLGITCAVFVCIKKKKKAKVSDETTEA